MSPRTPRREPWRNGEREARSYLRPGHQNQPREALAQRNGGAAEGLSIDRKQSRARHHMALGRGMKRPYRQRAGHAPARPAELRRRRTERVPSTADVFQWLPGEFVESVRRPNLATNVIERCRAMYGRTKPAE
jgi:hypothetical protein